MAIFGARANAAAAFHVGDEGALTVKAASVSTLLLHSLPVFPILSNSFTWVKYFNHALGRRKRQPTPLSSDPRNLSLFPAKLRSIVHEGVCALCVTMSSRSAWLTDTEGTSSAYSNRQNGVGVFPFPSLHPCFSAYTSPPRNKKS